VKSSDTPSPNPRSYLPRLVDAPHAPEEKEEKEAKFQPRYVDLPALRERGHGRRNLWWGLFTLVLAMALLALAVFFAGVRAAVSLGICLLTCSALFVMARLHLFRQRNGSFLALSIVCLLGALFALAEPAFMAADTLIRNQGMFAFAPAATHAAGSDAPASFNPKKRQVKILKDSRIVIDEQPFLIKAGDLFPYVESKGGRFLRGSCRPGDQTKHAAALQGCGASAGSDGRTHASHKQRSNGGGSPLSCSWRQGFAGE
jgi:hypothetical protein